MDYFQRPDVYASMQDLLSNETFGVDYVIRAASQARSNKIVVISPHGGRIEECCSEITHFIAGDDYTYFDFSGTKSGDNSILHVTSSRYFDPKLDEIIGCAELVISIHGFRSDEELILLGGRDLEKRSELLKALEANNFPVEIALPPLAGMHTDNLCNRGRHGKGIQIEISAPLRSSFDKSDPKMKAFCGVIRSLLEVWHQTL